MGSPYVTVDEEDTMMPIKDVIANPTGMVILNKVSRHQLQRYCLQLRPKGISWLACKASKIGIIHDQGRKVSN